MVVVSAIHDIPCTFTAQITLHAKYGNRHRINNYTQYSIKDSMMAQEGFIPQGYPAASSKIIYKAPMSYTIVEPMFDDHLSCAILPVSEDSFPCFAMDDNARKDASNIECPKSSVYYRTSQRCDRWKYRDSDDALNTWYFLAGTFTPVQHEYDGDYYELYDFISFDTKQPDPKAFQTPSGVPCNDLTRDNTAPKSVLDMRRSHFAGYHGAVLKPFSEHKLVNNEASVNKINKKATSWKAGTSSVFNGMTYAEAARRMLRPPTPTVLGDINRRYVVSETNHNMMMNARSIPESFDASKQWPKCDIQVSRVQGNCGSCWAFGSTVALGDRFCIARNFTAPLKLSPQYAVSCFENLNGCNGGFTDLAWSNLMNIGTVEENCFRYRELDLDCPRKCDDGSNMVFYKAKNAYALYSKEGTAKTVEMIQRDILTNGPVEGAFWVFEDFFHYTSGVYQRTPGSAFAGGHAIKIYGWGVDEDTKLPYWLIANSWGSNWGENGSFRILRGSNECSIEDNVAAGLPRVK